jgi:hypothetical protein
MTLTIVSGLAASIARFMFFLRFDLLHGDVGRLDLSTTLEVSSYLISGCILHMRPLIDACVRRFRSTITGVSSYGSAVGPKSSTRNAATGKRSTFQHSNESEGELIVAGGEGDQKIYVMRTIAVQRSESDAVV